MNAGGELRTAEDLLAQIQADHPDFTESTVYRTLALLEDLSLVDHVHLGHGPSHWHMKGTGHNWYLTCTNCGQVIEADPDPIESLAAAIADQTGFKLDAGHFAVTGTCASCTGPKAVREPEGSRPNTRRSRLSAEFSASDHRRS
jgi:Fur family ferric uptake transcriptional regulator